MNQLELVPAERRYTCCDQPCGPIDRPSDSTDYPHAEDCPNPSIGTWLDRFGRPLRRLWCSDTARLGGPCPYTGDKLKHRPAGGCCKDLASRGAA